MHVKLFNGITNGLTQCYSTISTTVVNRGKYNDKSG